MEAERISKETERAVPSDMPSARSRALMKEAHEAVIHRTAAAEGRTPEAHDCAAHVDRRPARPKQEDVSSTRSRYKTQEEEYKKLEKHARDADRQKEAKREAASLARRGSQIHLEHTVTGIRPDGATGS